MRVLRLVEAENEEFDVPTEEQVDDAIAAEETTEDNVEDEQDAEVYTLDERLDELRDILIDLDQILFMIDDKYYIIGRLNDEMKTQVLVLNGDTFGYKELPNKLDQILNTDIVVYSNDDNDVPHDKVVDFLMNELLTHFPDKYEELNKEKSKEEKPEPTESNLDIKDGGDSDEN